MLIFTKSIYSHLYIFQTNEKSIATQTPPSSTSQQAVEGVYAMWMMIATALLAVVILLTITSIALGTILCFTRKCVKSGSDSKLMLHHGLFRSILLYRRSPIEVYLDNGSVAKCTR